MNMDSIYGTKKYFQSLSGASDIYRSTTNRPLHNQISYQATLGRRPPFGAYHHMSNPACIKNYNLHNPYTLNSWGIGREAKSLAPSVYSTAKGRIHQQKSFSILLTTAAFILLLAIITVAALAYYISAMKLQIDDSMLGFEGSFQITEGDSFTLGPKYNTTTLYKQKMEFYKRFLERSLLDFGLAPLHTEVSVLGEGGLTKVNFKTLLDVRKWPQTDLGAEDFIREAIFSETVTEKSLYRFLRIDMDHIIVKRMLNDKSYKPSFENPKALITNPPHPDKRVVKKANKNYINPATKSDVTTRKYTRTTKSPAVMDNEDYNAEIENAPVVHGSFEGFFEITKADADIAQTKVSPTKAYSKMPAKMVTPHFLRVRPRKPNVEKIIPKPNGETVKVQNLTKATTLEPAVTTIKTVKTTINIRNEPLTTTSSTSSTTTTTTTTTSTTTTTTTTPATTTTQKLETTSNAPQTSIINKPPTLSPANIFANHAHYSSISSIKPPISQSPYAPVLDTQPWRPIHREELLPGPPPAYPTKTLYLTQRPPATEPFFNLFSKANNPIFSYNTFDNLTYENIERLGAGASIKPHPLPVSLIDEVVPSFKPINYKENTVYPTSSIHEDINNVHLTTTTDIVDIGTTSPEIVQQTKETTEKQQEVEKGEEENQQQQQQQQPQEYISYEIAAKSNPNTQNITALKEDDTTMTTTMPTTSTTTTKALFLNMKEIILKRNEAKNAINANGTNIHTNTVLYTATSPATTKTTSTTTKTTTTLSNIKRNDTKHTITLDDSYLFPSHSKWEFLNSSSTNNQLSTATNLRKVFNETLQAWVSEDIRETAENMTLNEIKTRINNVTNLQDISIIFDTLASKLGVTQSIPTKLPPLSENKFKLVQNKQISSSGHQDKIHKIPLTTTTESILVKMATVQWPNISENPIPLRMKSSENSMQFPESAEIMNTSSSEGIGAAIPVVGEADVEEMDPTKYEELLRSTNFAETSSRETLSELVTLLPARSNLGMRKHTQIPTSGN